MIEIPRGGQASLEVRLAYDPEPIEAVGFVPGRTCLSLGGLWPIPDNQASSDTLVQAENGNVRYDNELGLLCSRGSEYYMDNGGRRGISQEWSK